MKTEIQVNGRPVRVYSHGGLSYLEGREGSVYTIKLVNTTGNRIKAVVSVDSLNVVDGKVASGGPEEAGYVLNPWQAYDVKGFRYDNGTVAAFTFGKKESSYAAGKGEIANCGVIAVRYFSEKQKPAPQVIEKHIHYYPIWPYYWEWENPKPYRRDYIWYSTTVNDAPELTTSYSCSTGSSTGSGTLRSTDINMVQCSLSNSADFNLGTQWGAAINDSVTETSFEVDRLIEETTFYYSDKAGLEKAGIKLIPERQVVLPRAFNGKFCEPPVGWKV